MSTRFILCNTGSVKRIDAYLHIDAIESVTPKFPAQGGHSMAYISMLSGDSYTVNESVSEVMQLIEKAEAK